MVTRLLPDLALAAGRGSRAAGERDQRWSAGGLARRVESAVQWGRARSANGRARFPCLAGRRTREGRSMTP